MSFQKRYRKSIRRQRDVFRRDRFQHDFPVKRFLLESGEMTCSLGKKSEFFDGPCTDAFERDSPSSTEQRRLLRKLSTA